MDKENRLKPVEDRVASLEGRAVGLRRQVVSLAKWIKDIRWKLADLFRTQVKTLEGLDYVISRERVPEKDVALSVRFWWIKNSISREWEHLNEVSSWIRFLDGEFARLAGKQPILPEDSGEKDIAVLSGLKTAQDWDDESEMSKQLSAMESACDTVQLKIAELTESIQTVHYRAADFFGIDPSLFFSFQPTAKEIADIEAKTGRDLFPPKRKRGLFERLFGRRNP